MKVNSFYDNGKRKPRVVKKLSKKFYDNRGLVKYLGLAMFVPGLTKAKCASLKRSCRSAPMRVKRLIHEHLAFHKRIGYTAVKLRYHPDKLRYTKMLVGKHRNHPTTRSTDITFSIVSKLVPEKDVSFWETMLNVSSIIR